LIQRGIKNERDCTCINRLKEIIHTGFIYSLLRNQDSQELIKEYIKELEKWKQKLENVQKEAKDLEDLQDKVNEFFEG
jgi:predicted nuclease with TOPRIM domain